MKKFARIALTACLLLGIAAQANAVDFKIKGRWISLFDYGQNGNMTGGNGSTGYAKTGIYLLFGSNPWERTVIYDLFVIILDRYADR